MRHRVDSTVNWVTCCQTCILTFYSRQVNLVKCYMPLSQHATVSTFCFCCFVLFFCFVFLNLIIIILMTGTYSWCEKSRSVATWNIDLNLGIESTCQSIFFYCCIYLYLMLQITQWVSLSCNMLETFLCRPVPSLPWVNLLYWFSVGLEKTNNSWLNFILAVGYLWFTGVFVKWPWPFAEGVAFVSFPFECDMMLVRTVVDIEEERLENGTFICKLNSVSASDTSMWNYTLKSHHRLYVCTVL